MSCKMLLQLAVALQQYNRTVALHSRVRVNAVSKYHRACQMYKSMFCLGKSSRSSRHGCCYLHL